MNKEIKFSMKFDTGDFDRAVEKMQQKLKDIAGLGKGPGGPGGPGGAPPGGASGAGAGGGTGDAMLTKPGMEAFFKSMQALRTNMHSTMAQHGKEQMKLMKDIAKEEERRGNLLKDQEKISKNKTKDLQEELRIKKELKQTEEAIKRLTNEAGRNKSSFDAARGAANGATQPVFVVNWPDGGGPGGGGPGGGGGGGSKGNKFLSGLGKSLGTAAALLATGATLIDSYTSLPLTKTGSLGSATQSLIGSNLQDIASGNVVGSMAWMKERQRASEMAQARFGAQQVMAPMNVLHGGLELGKSMLTGGGAGKDADANFLMGSVTKAMEKVFDVGGLVPNRLSKSLGAASEQYFTTHQAQLMEDFGKNYENMLQAQQKENPLKNLAVNYLQGRTTADLQSQRMMGLGDEGFYGRKGLLQNANTAGFTGDMAMQMAQNIQGAGGSTRGMSGNATLGLKAQRGFDMTNAGSILGSISSGVGDAGVSERIFKRVLEEGVKNGLDKSESVEELRRSSQMTAEIVAKTGAVTGEDTSRIMENFSRFMNTGGGNIPTTKELEGSKASYQEYQGRSAETSGRRGALQFAAMQKQGLGGMGAQAIGSLMEMPEEDITSTNDRVVAMAEEYGMDPSDLRDKLLKAKQQMQDVDVNLDPKYRQTLKDAGITGKMTKEQLDAATPEVRKAYGEIRKSSSLNTSYQTAQKAEADALSLQRGGVITPETTEAGAGIDKRLGAGPGDRVGDDVTKAAGVAAQAMLENFRDFKKEITPAADALDMFTKKLIILGQVANMTPESDRAAMLNYAGQKLFTPAGGSQQASKPPTGGSNR